MPLLLLELKNVIGAGGADAAVRAGLLYRKFWSHEKVPYLFPLTNIRSPGHQDESRASCCPALPPVLMGPWLCVLGAVFADKPIVQPLTPLLWSGNMHARNKARRLQGSDGDPGAGSVL